MAEASCSQLMDFQLQKNSILTCLNEFEQKKNEVAALKKECTLKERTNSDLKFQIYTCNQHMDELQHKLDIANEINEKMKTESTKGQTREWLTLNLSVATRERDMYKKELYQKQIENMELTQNNSNQLEMIAVLEVAKQKAERLCHKLMEENSLLEKERLASKQVFDKFFQITNRTTAAIKFYRDDCTSKSNQIQELSNRLFLSEHNLIEKSDDPSISAVHIDKSPIDIFIEFQQHFNQLQSELDAERKRNKSLETSLAAGQLN